MSPRPYIVNQPGPLTQRADGVWTVDDSLPGREAVPRRMTIVKRDDGLLFFNAIPLGDDALAQVRSFGTPKHLIVPNQFHAIDAAPFSLKLGLNAWSSNIAANALQSRLKLIDVGHLPPQAGHSIFTVTGFATHETVLIANDSLIVADLCTNVPHGRGFTALFMRLIGFTAPHPILPRVVRRRVGRDFPAVKALFLELASQSQLKRIIPSHGHVFEGDVPAALRAIADSL